MNNMYENNLYRGGLVMKKIIIVCLILMIMLSGCSVINNGSIDNNL